MKPFNELLREKFEQSGTDQVEFAKTLGIAQAVLSRYISGKTEPKYKQFLIICRKLDINTDKILV